MKDEKPKNQIYLTVIYSTAPEKFDMILTPDPKNLLTRMEKARVQRQKFKIGYSYRFEDNIDALTIKKNAENLLVETGSKSIKSWFRVPVSRSFWAINKAISQEQSIREALKARGNVVGSLKFERILDNVAH